MNETQREREREYEKIVKPANFASVNETCDGGDRRRLFLQ